MTLGKSRVRRTSRKLLALLAIPAACAAATSAHADQTWTGGATCRRCPSLRPPA